MVAQKCQPSHILIADPNREPQLHSPSMLEKLFLPLPQHLSYTHVTKISGLINDTYVIADIDFLSRIHFLLGLNHVRTTFFPHY